MFGTNNIKVELETNGTAFNNELYDILVKNVVDYDLITSTFIVSCNEIEQCTISAYKFKFTNYEQALKTHNLFFRSLINYCNIFGYEKKSFYPASSEALTMEILLAHDFLDDKMIVISNHFLIGGFLSLMLNQDYKAVSRFCEEKKNKVYNSNVFQNLIYNILAGYVETVAFDLKENVWRLMKFIPNQKNVGEVKVIRVVSKVDVNNLLKRMNAKVNL